MNNRATILLAHGSRAEASNSAHVGLCEEVATTTGVRILPGFLELAEPSFATAFDDAVRQGAEHITVIPHFLAPGNHVQRDVPELIEAAKATHPNVDVVVTAHTGAAPGLVDLIGALISAG